ncbi:D-alanine--D-alanine ligase family protein [Stenotrophomonas sp.]|uniref:D-alanine--D-alanine ligase family protein n=1 Tax=Stenotrophomonas sp. TaxID=69392 RepID=UPI002899D6A3|nr:D-alanine--D-alanine ligase family protein [Stenotrophomonas sp.]
MSKKTVALLYGGISPEHEVSIVSARSVFESIDSARYHVIPIAIDRQGRWWLGESTAAPDPSAFPSEYGVTLLPGGRGQALAFHTVTGETKELHFDIALPVLHGQGGEDGSIQGLLETARIPYVGSGVLASAACMDKQVTKGLLRDAGVPVTPFLSLTRTETPQLSDLKRALGGETFFVKPARLGSSIGISKVATESELANALALAFDQDEKVIIETMVVGREIECGVLQRGFDDLLATWPSEISLTSDNHAFYTYDAKYNDPGAVRLDIRANIDAACAERVQYLSLRAFRVLGCEGMARVDFFLKDNGDLLVNEVNTIPGFTSHSMYPKMIEAAGITYTALLDVLMQQAVARHAQ